MKKIYILTAMLLTSIAFSQIRYGGSLSLNATNIVDQHSFSTSRIGFGIGAKALIPLDRGGDQFYLQPEVWFSQEGENNETPTGKEKYYLNYINVPVLAKIYFNENYNQFFGEVGPTVGFLIGENIDPENGEGFANEYNGIDIAATVGLGYSFDRRYEVFIRYNYGFSDVVTNTDIKNRSSNLNFGIAYILD